MTEEDDRGGFLDGIKDAISNIMGGDHDERATGSDAIANVPTDVAGAAGNTVADVDAGSGGSGSEGTFGPGEGGLADVLPGGPGIGTDEDDTPADR